MPALSRDTVIRSLEALTDLQVTRTGRTSLMGWFLIHGKLAPGKREIGIASIGDESVGPELQRFFQVAEGTSLPYVNPFGKVEGRLEYLALGYERRGTFTHFYEGRNLRDVFDVSSADGKFLILAPESSTERLRTKLGRQIPWRPAAGFLLHREQFPDGADDGNVLARFKQVFNMTDDEFDVLFSDSVHLDFEFGPDPFGETLDELPPHLRPPAALSTHETTAGVATGLVNLAQSSDPALEVSDALLRRVRRAFARSKAIALVGAPGTGKSRIIDAVLAEAADNPSVLGLTSPPKYVRYSAEVDWTARTIIGGYYPEPSGELVFREGYLLQAVRNNQSLWLDEMNRADLDRILGPLFTFLAGQTVDLGPTTQAGSGQKSMLLAWSKDPASDVKEDSKFRVYSVGTDWRLIGTYNNVDRGKVFPLGSALQRRWALIPVQPVSADSAAQLFSSVAGVRAAVSDVLRRAYEHQLGFQQIGPAPFLEMARYIADDNDEAEGASLTAQERELLADAYVLHMGQQLQRLDPERREEFINGIIGIFGPELGAEIAGHWS